jgi:hypothetical protein
VLPCDLAFVMDAVAFLELAAPGLVIGNGRGGRFIFTR